MKPEEKLESEIEEHIANGTPIEMPINQEREVQILKTKVNNLISQFEILKEEVRQLKKKVK